MLKLNKEQALRLLSAPANSFQIMGHKMSLNYSRNNMWLFMDVLEVFSEVRVVATCTVGCPVLMEGTVELDPVAWGWWPQHLIMCLQQTWGPSCSGVSQMELLHIHCCPTGAAPLRLLFGVFFFVAFVAHCKTAVGDCWIDPLLWPGNEHGELPNVSPSSLFVPLYYGHKCATNNNVPNFKLGAGHTRQTMSPVTTLIEAGWVR